MNPAIRRRYGTAVLFAAVGTFSAGARLGAQNPAPRAAAPAQPAAARGSAADIRTLKIRENVYLLSGAGSNVVVQLFPQGVTVIDSGTAANAQAVLAAIRQLTPKPVVHIINTGAAAEHWGGNATLAAAGRRIPVDIIAADANSAGEGPTIVAHEDVLMRLSAKSGTGTVAPERAWPTDTYHSEYKKLSARFHGGEAIQLVSVPKANSDGNSLVWLRHADVIATGDIYSTVGYPPVDLAAGGTIDGVIAGLNEILDLAFFDYRSEGGTLIVPGHGRLSDGADVAYYRDMVTVIRDRVQDAIEKGSTLAQVKAAGLTRDYDPRYGATSGSWTTEMFVEAVYKSLGGK